MASRSTRTRITGAAAAAVVALTLVWATPAAAQRSSGPSIDSLLIAEPPGGYRPMNDRPGLRSGWLSAKDFRSLYEMSRREVPDSAPFHGYGRIWKRGLYRVLFISVFRLFDHSAPATARGFAVKAKRAGARVFPIRGIPGAIGTTRREDGSAVAIAVFPQGRDIAVRIEMFDARSLPASELVAVARAQSAHMSSLLSPSASPRAARSPTLVSRWGPISGLVLLLLLIVAALKKVLSGGAGRSPAIRVAAPTRPPTAAPSFAPGGVAGLDPRAARAYEEQGARAAAPTADGTRASGAAPPSR